MRIRLDQVVIDLDYDYVDVVTKVCDMLECSGEAVADVRVMRRSIDARGRRGTPVFVLAVELDFPDESAMELVESGKVRAVDLAECGCGIPKIPESKRRPVVVGAGPAGLFAALTLAKAGLRPVVLERGKSVGERKNDVGAFWEKGEFDHNSNVLYGEGGAGLFSDGKLMSRSKDHEGTRRVLKTFVECGAPEEIMIDSEPHLGSDKLFSIVEKIRERIIALGGEFQFGSCLDGLYVERGRLKGLRVSGNYCEADYCVLATGHSARDVYAMLDDSGVSIEAKPFAVGVRVEIPQKIVDRTQWGKFAGHPQLGAASFRLTRKSGSEHRACYSFCMCPGGQVIACASDEGFVTTNGMSMAARSGKFANAAFLVPVGVDDFPEGFGALAGIEFQKTIEQKVFAAGGGDYGLPAAFLKDFLEGKKSGLPGRRSCRRTVPSDISALLPDFVASTLRANIPSMLKTFSGLKIDKAMVYAAETRSSSPVRIVRGLDCESASTKGLYPAGEGSGYAGGIMSSAIDGIRVAEKIIAGLSAS